MPSWKKVITSGSDAQLNQITASGDISASGTVTSNGLVVLGGAAVLDSFVTTDDSSINGSLTVTQNITASNDISSSGTITANSVDINGSTIFGDTPASNTHQFTGSMFISGSGNPSLTIDGKISLNSGTPGNQEIKFGGAARIQGNDTFLILDSDNQFVARADDKMNFNTPLFGLGGFDTGDTPSATLHISGAGDTRLFVEGNITASGDISSSGDFIGSVGKFSQIEIDGEVALNTTDGATTGTVFSDSQITKIKIGKEAANTSTVIEGAITASGAVSASGAITATDPTLTYASASIIGLGNGEGYGEVIELWPAHGGTVAGDVVFYIGSAGIWRTGTAASSYAINMAGVALEAGDGSTPCKVLTKGVVRLAAGHILDTSGADGDPLYVGDTIGHVAFAAPGSSGEYARIVGYCLVEDDDIIYFNPDNTYVEVS